MDKLDSDCALLRGADVPEDQIALFRAMTMAGQDGNDPDQAGAALFGIAPDVARRLYQEMAEIVATDRCA